MAGPKKRAPPAADPRRGKNPGYAENHPRDARDAHQPAIPSQPTPDEAGMGHDPDAQPSRDRAR
jgi:hypothetical protein